MLLKTKTELRKHFKDLRNGFDADYRINADKSIASRFFDLPEFINSELILVYVSVDNEIDTKLIIEKSFSLGKTVAVPFCKNNEMHFYIINSFSDLVNKQFGIPTVNPDIAEKASNFSNALCVVPALSIDKSGNRLGYGGGYYDRFLSANNIKSVALCREKQLTESLPAEEFDIRIRKIVIENKIVEIQEV